MDSRELHERATLSNASAVIILDWEEEARCIPLKIITASPSLIVTSCSLVPQLASLVASSPLVLPRLALIPSPPPPAAQVIVGYIRRGRWEGGS